MLTGFSVAPRKMWIFLFRPLQFRIQFLQLQMLTIVKSTHFYRNPSTVNTAVIRYLRTYEACRYRKSRYRNDGAFRRSRTPRRSLLIANKYLRCVRVGKTAFTHSSIALEPFRFKEKRDNRTDRIGFTDEKGKGVDHSPHLALRLKKE